MWKKGYSIYACQPPSKNIISLKGECIAEDQPDTAIGDVPLEYHTRLPQYSSAEYKNESEDLIGIRKMSLGPSVAANLCNRA